MLKLYGIKNCDTVRKARKWLEQNNLAHEFIDFRETPVGPDTIQRWLDAAGDKLLNKRSTTWKQLGDEDKAADSDAAVIALLTQYPTLIKRPVLETADAVSIGFSEQQYQQLT